MHGLIRYAFPKQIGRLEYLVRLLVCELIVGYLLVFHDATEPGIGIAALVVWHYAAFFVLWPRMRDCGMSSICVVLSLVPLFFVFLSIVLLFKAPEFRFQRSAEEAPPKGEL